MKNRPILLFPSLFLSVLLVSSSFLHADWILIDDFESYEEGVYASGDRPLFYPIVNNGGDPMVEIITGTEGTGGDKAIWFWDRNSIMGGRIWHLIPLPEEIGFNESGTLYWRMWVGDPKPGWTVMVSKVAADEAPQNVDFWGSTTALVRDWPDNEPALVQAFNGGSGYLNANPPLLSEAEVWYEYWMVLDNTFEGSLQTGGYSIYRRGPGERWPTLVTWQSGDGNPLNKLVFRDTSFAAIKTVGFYPLVLNFGLWLIDDIYMTLGACLSDPRTGDSCEIWCEYPVVDGHADTGSWLGWLYVATEPWVYSYVLDGWLYVPDCPDAAGGWVHVAR